MCPPAAASRWMRRTRRATTTKTIATATLEARPAMMTAARGLSTSAVPDGVRDPADVDRPRDAAHRGPPQELAVRVPGEPEGRVDDEAQTGHVAAEDEKGRGGRPDHLHGRGDLLVGHGGGQLALHPAAVAAGDPVQRGVTEHGTCGAGDHHPAELEESLRGQRRRGVQRRLPGQDRDDRVPEDQGEDGQVRPGTLRLLRRGTALERRERHEGDEQEHQDQQDERGPHPRASVVDPRPGRRLGVAHRHTIPSTSPVEPGSAH